MKKLLLPLLILLASAAGAGGGLWLRARQAPPEVVAAGDCPVPATDAVAAESAAVDAHGNPLPPGAKDYVKIANQFVVPIVENGQINSMVIVSLSLEVTPGAGDQVFLVEPKLRDAFLQVLFAHANSGGFRGAFTETATLAPLRMALREAGKGILGEKLTDVLIVDIIRQDS